MPRSGDPVLVPTPVQSPPPDGILAPTELLVGGSGVYTLCLENRSFLSAAEFSVSLAHWPQVTPEEAAEAAAAAEMRRVELRACRTEMETLCAQEAELAQAEDELAQRLWEVRGRGGWGKRTLPWGNGGVGEGRDSASRLWGLPCV